MFLATGSAMGIRMRGIYRCSSSFFILILLPNQTWVYLPVHNKASLLTSGFDEVKCSVYCRVPSKKYRATKCLKDPNSLKAFIEGFLKTGWGVVQYMISSWTSFWLIGYKVTGSQHHQPSDYNQSAVYVLVGSIQITSSTWRGFQSLQNSTKDLPQNIIYSPEGGTKGPWL